MAIQKVPLEALQKVRQHIKIALAVPDVENTPKAWTSLDEADELPEPDSLADLGSLFNFGGSLEEESHAPNIQGRWFISVMDPGAALMKLPGLSLKPDLRLVGYLHRTETEGTGIIWAVPEDFSTTTHLEAALRGDPGKSDCPPKPDGALADVMEAIAGDGSPLSFVIASLMRREFLEFGAVGKLCNWNHHRLVNALPPQVSWQWRTEEHKDLSPKVRVLPDGRAAVEFFTCRVAPPVGVFQHIDQYVGGHYRANCLDRTIAVPQRS